MHESHPVWNLKLKDHDYSKLITNQTTFLYKSALENLMWLVNSNRPDVTYSVNFLARF